MKPFFCAATILILIGVCAFGCSKKPQDQAKNTFEMPFHMPKGPEGFHIPGFIPPSAADIAKLCEVVGFDEQTGKKIMEIIRGFDTSMKERIIKVQREELNIREELLKDKPDLAYIQRSITNKTSLFAEIEMAQIKRDLDIKALLTPEQYERWSGAVFQKMRERMPQGMRDQGMPPMSQSTPQPGN
ncbi:MAG: hypothetical protein A2268_06130 [Candidatus Raymondbacteria bacterium RifOxyA12_full_50_37]|uniref:Periplasmic heavy metal sensor n=1 Tax=Candidatus Raymondbacteria bacterium RIFOXYD12_FULL_49_13 TaxID=1817890 RepID=A0A1F7FKP7_UNCRA|nr:MAG: hypothetical protein A2268_06130 [Candidatus Raymondbacteria bacterium RifOxyA12_full_50_37]OGJ94546.1 MAG: hypothetical protein A2248_15060 [Candidatus Raymondbacteria bacterium RIFOXYA2_FULL_49_16]OGJ98504.1 MAG: hypothetical protein A2487_05405 [Candidatus Raymondbacteria bacterium RifOxyC12_full_50_8]OGK01695.1 MAG: hypothetical protein A2350_10790 [Candidatus Raymondbacteria bacterium RifOxyB12_full_50_8]OGK07022.1 MAG: hypothetical protein A2519_13700 [Candidatus Raymondbacteria b